MDKNITFRKKIIIWAKKLPSKKIYLEFFTALIGIPVAITWLILNVNSVRNLYSQKANVTPTPVIQEKVIIEPSNGENNQSQNTTPTTPTSSTCIKQIGPIAIASPQEGQTISDNPVTVEINYSQGNYCSVLWSYQINNGQWSGYNNNSVALYNLPEGNISFNLMVKSVASPQTLTLTRNFIYNGNGSLVPTPTEAPTPLITSEVSPIATDSADLK